MSNPILLRRFIDLIFLEKFSTGIVVSLLLFFVVELMIRAVKMNDHQQKSNLYLIVLLSNFSVILFTLFFFDVRKNGDDLFFVFPDVRMELAGLLKICFMTLKKGVPILDLRIIVLILVSLSLSIFFFSLFLSRFYFERRFHLRKCEDERVLRMVEKICHSKKIEIMTFEGDINAFVFGVPPVLAVSRELLERVSDKELELVLRHEINHLRNYDNILKPLLFSLRVLFFYSPVVHILSRKIAREREFIADRVSEVKKERVLFLYTLVKLSELQIERKNRLVSLVSSPLVKSHLRVRTETLLSENRRGNPHVYGVSLWLFAVLLFGGVCVSGNLMASRISGPPVALCGAPEGMYGHGVSVKMVHLRQSDFLKGGVPVEEPGGAAVMYGIKGLDTLHFPDADLRSITKTPTLYSVNTEMVIAVFLILPLITTFSEYALIRVKVR